MHSPRYLQLTVTYPDGVFAPFSYPKDTLMLKAYTRAVARINSLRTEEEGATATEYALIIGVASIAIVTTLALLAPAIEGFITTTVIPALNGTP
jgi:Flp pilus assembly pilin Flp